MDCIQTRLTSALRASPFSQVRKPLRLIVDDVDEENPSDIAYTYSGYAPLSVRLVQCVLQKQSLSEKTGSTVTGYEQNASGWKGFEDTVKLLRGKTFHEVQGGEEKAMGAKRKRFFCYLC